VAPRSPSTCPTCSTSNPPSGPAPPPLEQLDQREVGDDALGGDPRRTTRRCHTWRPSPAASSLLRASDSTSRNFASGAPRQLAGEVHGAGRVAKHLHGLEVGEVGEEPAARREHRQRVPLALEQRERIHRVARDVLGRELVTRQGSRTTPT